MTPTKINNPVDGTLKFQFTQLEYLLSIDVAAATAVQIVKYFCSPTGGKHAAEANRPTVSRRHIRCMPPGAVWQQLS